MSDDDGPSSRNIVQPVQVVMAQSVSIKPVPEFHPDAELGASLATRWKDWMADFDMFILASGITDATRKRALLLYQAGPRIREIFQQLPDTGTATDYEVAKAKLQEYFEPQKNRRYEVYRFRQATQACQETLDQFHTRLRTLAQTCEFQDTTFELEEQIIIGGTSSKIRKRALRDPGFDLKAMLLEGRRDEQSAFQAKDIESKEPIAADANRIVVNANRTDTKKSSKCYSCGRAYLHNGTCPAKGKECNNCGKMNHFSNVCRDKSKLNYKPARRTKGRKKAVHPLNTADGSDSSDEDYIYAVKNTANNSPSVNVTVCGHMFKTTVDTGATINVIDQNTYAKMENAELKHTKMKAFAYNNPEPVKFLGKFDAVVETKKRVALGTFYVTKGIDSGNLLSLSTAQDLGLVSLHLQKLSTMDGNISSIINKHASVFTGLGKLKGAKVTLSIDETKTPKAQPQRRIPYHVRQQVKIALTQLEKEDIIEKVPEHEGTPWVSPIVVVPKKDGGVRICVDMRAANEAIKRVRHPIPTVDDVSFELNGAKYFTKLDLSQAYHQLELDEDSRHITTFSTHVGLYRYKRLNYGTNAAAEIFQYVLQTQLQGLKGVKNIADDIIVYGTTREEHDENLDKCLTRLKQKGLTLNQNKCKFLSNTLEFLGQIFSDEGTRPDPKRVHDLLNAEVPKDIRDVRSLLGMANYSSKYIENFATITAPLRELTKKNNRFEWTEVHQDAFNQLTNALSTAPCMSYFDKNKDTYVLVDASPVGLCAILSQKSKDADDQKVVAYASRALTDVEKRYSQTEKEALAIVWSVEHFHLFLYGHPFTLITDHKPLEVIYGHRQSKPSARIERWVLRLQPYTFQVVYKPGEQNPADYLSRHPTSTSIRKQEKMTEEYVNFIAEHSVPKTMTLKEIADETNNDRDLRALRAAIRLNSWELDSVRPYRSFKADLTIGKHNTILRGSRIIIPKSLQKRAVEIAHESHQGLSKTKALLREKIWFVGIDELVQKTIDSCLACQAVGKPAPPEPIKQNEMPKGPWETLHIDFCGPLPSNDYLLVLIDRYSRYPEVEIVRSTRSACVIPKLDKIFAVHGIPYTIVSDNGPPFNSDEFNKYMKILGIEHHLVTPYWPQANGEVERFNQPLEKTIQAAVVEGKIWRQELNKFLLQYRTTPHCTTKVPPSELLFNRKIRGKLPSIEKKLVVNRHKEARENEKKSQAYHKSYADNRRNVKDSDIEVGDTVLVKQKRKDKFSSRFSKTPYVVIYRRGTQIIAENDQKHRVKRNVSHFKKFEKTEERPDEIESELDEDFIGNYNNELERESEQEEQSEQTVNRWPKRERRPPVRYGHPIHI